MSYTEPRAGPVDLTAQKGSPNPLLLLLQNITMISLFSQHYEEYIIITTIILVVIMNMIAMIILLTFTSNRKTVNIILCSSQP